MLGHIELLDGPQMLLFVVLLIFFCRRVDYESDAGDIGRKSQHFFRIAEIIVQVFIDLRFVFIVEQKMRRRKK